MRHNAAEYAEAKRSLSLVRQLASDPATPVTQVIDAVREAAQHGWRTDDICTEANLFRSWVGDALETEEDLPLYDRQGNEIWFL